MSFRDDQVSALRAKLNAKAVQTRVVNGFNLSFVEGWYTIEEANRIFGFDGWDRETVSSESIWQGNNHGVHTCSYTARVRIKVHAGDREVIREGSGYGTGTGNTPGEAHEKALKEAETDAMKRALSTFGNRFGLCLYDKSQKGVAKPKKQKIPTTDGQIVAAANTSSNGSGIDSSLSGWVLKDHAGTAIEILEAPQLFYAKARKMLEALREPEHIRQLWYKNEEALRSIRIAHPDLRDQIGTHYTVLFARLCKEQAAIAEAGRSAATDRRGNGASRRDGHSQPEQSGEQTPVAEAHDLNGSQGESVVEAKAERVVGGEEVLRAGEVEISLSSEPANESLVEGRATEAVPQTNGHRSNGIDKSQLLIGAPKRIRDKGHLKAVAQQPCLICGRSPSHAHHLTFVQPRARGLKTSDEWVVPLCYLHHRELHDRGNEREWWKERGIRPITEAENYWKGRKALNF
jgi:DNA recombination protein Rad52